MRKLGFEETPDYDFLRELFSKVLKNSGEAEDGVYDWMLLNNGKGWEAGVRPPSSFSSFSIELDLDDADARPASLLSSPRTQSSNMLSSSAGYDSRHHRARGERDRDRERERAERHAQRAAAAAAAAAAAQGGSGAVAGAGGSSGAATPTAATREAKVGRQPSASATPQPGASAMAVKGVTPPTPAATSAPKANRTSSGHPYASAVGATGGGGGYERGESDYAAGGSAAQQQQLQAQAQGGYSRGGGAAAQGVQGMSAANDPYGQGAHDDEGAHRGGFSLMKFLTCRCG